MAKPHPTTPEEWAALNERRRKSAEGAERYRLRVLQEEADQENKANYAAEQLQTLGIDPVDLLALLDRVRARGF